MEIWPHISIPDLASTLAHTHATASLALCRHLPSEGCTKAEVRTVLRLISVQMEVHVHESRSTAYQPIHHMLPQPSYTPVEQPR